MVGLSYQLELRRKYLLSLCANWQSTFGWRDSELGTWGPTEAEILDAKVAAVQPLVTRISDEGSEESGDHLEVEEDSWSDNGLVEALETLDLTDGFWDYAYLEGNDNH